MYSTTTEMPETGRYLFNDPLLNQTTTQPMNKTINKTIKKAMNKTINIADYMKKDAEIVNYLIKIFASNYFTTL